MPRCAPCAKSAASWAQDHDARRPRTAGSNLRPATASSSPAPTRRPASSTARPAPSRLSTARISPSGSTASSRRRSISTPASFDQFRHGYAGTIYRGQGRTLDQTYLYHSEHWRSAASYVALTRHRDKAELFVARNTAADITQLGPANGAHRRPAGGLDVPPPAGHRPGTADDRARNAGALRRRELPPAAGSAAPARPRGRRACSRLWPETETPLAVSPRATAALST